MATSQPATVPDPEEESSITSQVSRLSIRAPPFWKTNPKTWFRTLEAQFALAHITVDLTKYHHVIATIDSEILDQVSDCMDNPPSNGKYEGIKHRLISLFAESDEKRLRKLLSQVELGDKKPSHLLNEMRSLGGAAVSPEILKTLWMQHLSTSIQPILAGSSEPLDKMANLADKIHEIVQPQTYSVQVSGKEAQAPQLIERISRLEQSMERLKPIRRSRSKSRTRRTETRSPSADPGVCWYHQRFRDKARQCAKPCSYQQEN
ncbi:uncharacterized protein [Euwallacea similis]|uniref:uncharacterized protein n=1 Tax=Euwallacea similis TaxID=1736056 RepID=UPI00344BD156